MPREGRLAASIPRRVVIVDGDHHVRRELAALVGLQPGLIVVGTAADPATAVRLVAEARPDVVVIDPGLPDLEAGLAAIGHLRRMRRAIGVVAMSCSTAVEDPALAAGADVFVAKDGQPNELLGAIDIVTGPSPGGGDDR